MTAEKYAVYGCPWCPNFITKDPELPDELRCTCFPIHGQYLPVEVEGEQVGTILVDSDVIRQMRGTHAENTGS